MQKVITCAYCKKGHHISEYRKRIYNEQKFKETFNRSRSFYDRPSEGSSKFKSRKTINAQKSIRHTKILTLTPNSQQIFLNVVECNEIPKLIVNTGADVSLVKLNILKNNTLYFDDKIVELKATEQIFCRVMRVHSHFTLLFFIVVIIEK